MSRGRLSGATISQLALMELALRGLRKRYPRRIATGAVERAVALLALVPADELVALSLSDQIDIHIQPGAHCLAVQQAIELEAGDWTYAKRGGKHTMHHIWEWTRTSEVQSPLRIVWIEDGLARSVAAARHEVAA